jgi:biopolymer transport protein ExbB/TolQ
MTNPYESPSERGTKKSRLFFFGVALLLVAVAMPILGLAGTIAGMVHSFNELSTAETPSPGNLASGISFSLTTTLVGVILGVVVAIVGVVLIVVSRRGGKRPAT